MYINVNNFYNFYVKVLTSFNDCDTLINSGICFKILLCKESRRLVKGGDGMLKVPPAHEKP